MIFPISHMKLKVKYRTAMSKTNDTAIVNPKRAYLFCLLNQARERSYINESFQMHRIWMKSVAGKDQRDMVYTIVVVKLPGFWIGFKVVIDKTV